MKIVLDTNVFLNAASCVSSDGSPSFVSAPAEPTFDFQVLRAIAQGRLPNVQLFAGEHIWKNVRQVLVRKFGWSVEAAAEYVAGCMQLVDGTGGCATVLVKDDARRCAELVVKAGVEDWEDAQIVFMAHAMGASIATNDGALRDAKIDAVFPNVAAMSVDNFVRSARTSAAIAA